MLDIIDILLLGVVSSLVAVATSVVAALVSHQLRNKDVDALYGRIESLDMAIRGAQGRINRGAANEEMEQAIGEALAGLQSGQPPAEVIKAVVAKHPTTALALAKKFGLKL